MHSYARKEGTIESQATKPWASTAARSRPWHHPIWLPKWARMLRDAKLSDDMCLSDELSNHLACQGGSKIQNSVQSSHFLCILLKMIEVDVQCFCLSTDACAS